VLAGNSAAFSDTDARGQVDSIAVLVETLEIRLEELVGLGASLGE